MTKGRAVRPPDGSRGGHHPDHLLRLGEDQAGCQVPAGGGSLQVAVALFLPSTEGRGGGGAVPGQEAGLGRPGGAGAGGWAWGSLCQRL